MHIALDLPVPPRGVLWCILLAHLAGACSTTSDPGPAAARLGFAVPPAALAVNGVPFAPQPVIQLEDAEGNPVAVRGRLVIASVSPAGVLSGTTEVRTDETGKAAFTGLTISGAVGERILRFESAGLGSLIADPIQLAPGPASLLTIASGNLQTAQAGTAVAGPPTVQVSDPNGNPVPGAPVVFAVTSGGGTVAGGAAVTGPDGRAAPAQWILGTEIGLNTLTATSSAVPGATAVFTATGILGPPAILTRVTGDGQTATVGGAVATAPAVKLTDALGHPLPNVAITFAVSGGGGAVLGASPLTDASGVATLGTWSLGLEPGPNTLTASRAGVPSVSFTASGVAFLLQNLDAGGDMTCGVRADGAGFCWGANNAGQVGNGLAVDVKVPTPVSGGLEFTTISAGTLYACGLVTGGAAWCWGNNANGQLGDGTSTSRSTPVPVAGGFSFLALSTYDSHTCGLVTGGAAYCWGLGSSGQLGDGTLSSRTTPAPVAGGRVFTSISVGALHSCGLEASGSLFCWGSNGNGRLGDGTTVNRSAPTPVSGGLSFAAMAASDSYTCAITTAGAGYCWGNGSFGFLGTGNTTEQLTPVPISGSLVLTAISSSGGHTCGLTAAGQAHCWGINFNGELGDGTFINRPVPTAVTGGLSFSVIRVGTAHTCGLSGSGATYCWGKNQFGAVGDGTNVVRAKPVGVVIP